jgi:hypothetical protein
MNPTEPAPSSAVVVTIKANGQVECHRNGQLWGGGPGGPVQFWMFIDDLRRMGVRTYTVVDERTDTLNPEAKQ